MDEFLTIAGYLVAGALIAWGVAKIERAEKRWCDASAERKRAKRRAEIEAREQATADAYMRCLELIYLAEHGDPLDRSMALIEIAQKRA